MLPYATYTMVKIRCPHCRKDVSKLRAAVKVGDTHKCTGCDKSFHVTELLPITTPRTR